MLRRKDAAEFLASETTVAKTEKVKLMVRLRKFRFVREKPYRFLFMKEFSFVCRKV